MESFAGLDFWTHDIHLLCIMWGEQSNGVTDWIQMRFCTVLHPRYHRLHLYDDEPSLRTSLACCALGLFTTISLSISLWQSSKVLAMDLFQSFGFGPMQGYIDKEFWSSLMKLDEVEVGWLEDSA